MNGKTGQQNQPLVLCCIHHIRLYCSIGRWDVLLHFVWVINIFNSNCLYWVALVKLDNLPFSDTIDINNFGCFMIGFLSAAIFIVLELQITRDCRKCFYRHMQHYFGYRNGISGGWIRSAFIIWLQLFSYVIKLCVLNWILITNICRLWCRIRDLTSERNFEEYDVHLHDAELHVNIFLIEALPKTYQVLYSNETLCSQNIYVYGVKKKS